MPKQRKRTGSKSKRAGDPTPEESLTLRAIEEENKRLRAEHDNAVDVRGELDALMDALREANGHLVVANLRSQALAEQMNELYEEAKSAIAAKDDFFSLISHELRTPLTSIIGWAALLGRNPDAMTIGEAARSIASSAAVQAKLVDDLLDVSRIMTGKFAITEGRLDLGTVIEDSVSGMRPEAAAKGLTLRMKVQRPVMIIGDEERLRQVVTNLLSNAIKFTPPGGLIETSLTVDVPSAVLEVCDTGEGIPPNFMPYLFERRAQLTARRFAGLGLGLAIVKHIVELHGGSVTATSEGEGKGATFTVRIPCAE